VFLYCFNNILNKNFKLIKSLKILLKYGNIVFWLIPTLGLNKIKIKLSIDFFCWLCRVFHCQHHCLLAYSYCLDPKCYVYDITVSTYVVYNTDV
jgi:hypothetical protein